MKRRTLDLIVSTGGILLSVLLLVVGIVLTSNANFAKKYVSDQLAPEKIQFPVAAELDAETKEFSQARTGCVIDNLGRTVATAAQAECYANEYLGAHLSFLPTRLGYTSVAWADGMRYRELGGELRTLGEKIAEAEEANSPALADLQQQQTDLTAVRQKMFEGTMLRNALLTSFGFGSLGERAGQAAAAVFIAAALLALLSLAGFAHALTTPKTKAFAPIESMDRIEVGELVASTAS